MPEDGVVQYDFLHSIVNDTPLANDYCHLCVQMASAFNAQDIVSTASAQIISDGDKSQSRAVNT